MFHNHISPCLISIVSDLGKCEISRYVLLKFCAKHGEVKTDISIVSPEDTNEQSLSEVRLLL